VLPAASFDGLELHRDLSVFRDQSVAWQCEQVCRSNASILWDRRSRRASIAGGAESVGRVARQGKRLVKNSIRALRRRPRIPSLSRHASLRSDRNFVRLVRVAKRQSEGAAAKNLFVFANAAQLKLAERLEASVTTSRSLCKPRREQDLSISRSQSLHRSKAGRRSDLGQAKGEWKSFGSLDARQRPEAIKVFGSQLSSRSQRFGVRRRATASATRARQVSPLQAICRLRPAWSG
jgi:hypothetical protein